MLEPWIIHQKRNRGCEPHVVWETDGQNHWVYDMRLIVSEQRRYHGTDVAKARKVFDQC